MSRFFNVPKIQLAVLLAPLLIKLRIELESRIIREIEEIKDKLIGECPDLSILQAYSKKINNIKEFLTKIEERGNKVKETLKPLIIAERSVLIGVTVLELLPVPNTTTTIGTTSKASQVLADLKQFAKDIHDEIHLISGLIEGSLGLLTVVSRVKELLTSIDIQVQSCINTGQLSPEQVSAVREDKQATVRESYTGPDGITYNIQVIIINDRDIAPLRQAIAYDQNDIIRFRSEQSYSSSTKVLIDEVKVRIDNNILN